ncbi:MAG: hypothetical protein EVA44_04480 [Flavobacteriales bacterium]|nr:MAG: hypothetical protein EVA44_04480 [Flavobacteriales bacterium]
MIFNEQRCQ